MGRGVECFQIRSSRKVIFKPKVEGDQGENTVVIWEGDPGRGNWETTEQTFNAGACLAASRVREAE